MATITMYEIWAVDCDGPGDVRYAPLFDTEEKAQAWIDNFMSEDPGDISRMWIEEKHYEEEDNE